MLKITFIVITSVIYFSLCHAQDSWKILGKLKNARASFGAVDLKNGKILVAGGLCDSDTGTLSTCEIIDVVAPHIYTTNSMKNNRAEFPLLYSNDGYVYAISGVNALPANSNYDLNTPYVEKYDVKQNIWKDVGTLQIARRGHCACFISHNQILIVGGGDRHNTPIPSVEIFNTATGESKLVAPLPYPLMNAQALVMQSGKVVVYGGITTKAWRFLNRDSDTLTKVLEYDVFKDTWSVVDSLYKGVPGAKSITLYDGRILVTGGAHSTMPLLHTKMFSIERNGNFVSDGLPYIAPVNHGLAQLDTNQVLIAGGMIQDPVYKGTCWSVSNAALFNIQTHNLKPVAHMNDSHSFHKVICTTIPVVETFRNVAVVIAGCKVVPSDSSGPGSGYGYTNTVEIFGSCSYMFDRKYLPRQCINNIVNLSKPSEYSGFRLLKWSTGDTISTIKIRPGNSYLLEMLDTATGCKISQEFIIEKENEPWKILSVIHDSSFISVDTVKHTVKVLLQNSTNQTCKINSNNVFNLARDMYMQKSGVVINLARIFEILPLDTGTVEISYYTPKIRKSNDTVKVVGSTTATSCYNLVVVNDKSTITGLKNDSEALTGLDFSNDVLEVYPLPSDKICNIKVNYPINNTCYIYVWDIHGNLIKNFIKKDIGDRFELETTDLSNGVYSISLLTNDNCYMVRFVILH
ncbi:MAG: hypothetical protein K1X91_06045 [Bacteriodetes bacterium]|nr:hypothetical protein [Bacteroidota bacterium]